MFRKFMTALLVLWGGWACAMSPENGVWWNPAESGTGYNFEIQNNRLWMYAYTYEANGLPVYLYSATTLTGTNQFTGTLNRSVNGSCIACPYHPNTEAAVGSVQIVFDSPSTATLTATTAQGTRSTRLQRFPFAIDERTPYKMMGEWSLVIGSKLFPVYFGDRLAFGDTFNSGGVLMAAGSRTGSSSNLAVASQQPDGTWSILLDASTSYYDYFTFRFSGLNTMEGTSWTFLKTSALSGSGLPFIGLRSGSASSVINGVGPALQQSSRLMSMPIVNLEAIAASKAQLSAVPSDDPDALRAADRARQVVREMLTP